QLNRQWSALRVTSSMSVTVAVLLDTAHNAHGLPRARRYAGGMPIDVFLPNATTAGNCIALVNLPIRGRLNPSVEGSLSSSETIEALLSPSAFLAAYGEPGPQISRWLFDARWAPSRLAAWNDSQPAWKSVVRGPIYWRGITESI